MAYCKVGAGGSGGVIEQCEQFMLCTSVACPAWRSACAFKCNTPLPRKWAISLAQLYRYSCLSEEHDFSSAFTITVPSCRPTSKQSTIRSCVLLCCYNDFISHKFQMEAFFTAFPNATSAVAKIARCKSIFSCFYCCCADATRKIHFSRLQTSRFFVKVLQKGQREKLCM